MTSKEIVKIAVDALDDKKANDIRVIDIRDISSMGDYFIIADGENKNKIRAMSDNVEEKLKLANVDMRNREGYSNGGWILLDYYDIIVHIFSSEERSFYDLEHIWRDGRIINLGDL